MHSPYTEALDIALFAAKEAAKLIIRARTEGFSSNFKGARDMLTSADLAAEKCIIEIIKSHFPNDQILSEELNPEQAAAAQAAERLWIIDPIDGTTNYAFGHQHVGISIAFAAEGAVRAGVVAAPFENEVFHALAGGGAFLNQQPISVKQSSDLRSSLIATGFPYKRDQISLIIERLTPVLEQCQDVRRLGAASLDLTWVACGRLHAYYEDWLNIWDIAAGALIAYEAGAQLGNIKRYDSTPAALSIAALLRKDIIAASPGIFTALNELVRER